jgi:hypothetical protein
MVELAQDLAVCRGVLLYSGVGSPGLVNGHLLHLLFVKMKCRPISYLYVSPYT